MFLKGSIVALVTPFTKDNRVDYVILEDLVKWHIDQKTDGIVILGTTGEAPTLSRAEREKIIQITCKVVSKKIPVIVGTGTSCTQKTIENTLIAKQLGADACLVIAPYYNIPEQKGLILHYQKVADTGLKTIIYHHPKRTGVTISFDTFFVLQDHPNIFAVKDATGDVELMENIIKKTSLKLFSGNDENTFKVMLKKATGSISVIANLIPKDWAKMHSLLINEQVDKAKQIFDNYYQLLNALSLEINPQCVKYGLSLINEDFSADLRLPLIKPSVNTQAKIKEALHQTMMLGSVA